MALTPKVKLKTVVSFPSTAVGRTGIDVEKQNGNFYIDLAFDDFAPPVGGITDPTHQNTLLWNSVTQAYTLTPISLLGGGGGIPDAPNDGTLYGRKSAMWAAVPAGISDAPNDGVQYGRQSLGWTPITGGGGGGLVPSTAPPHQFANAVTSGGALTYARPDAIDATYTAVSGTPRTVDARLKDYYSVLDYGADPTGVADSAPAFRTAIIAVPAGGMLRIPAGNYLLNSADPLTGIGILDFNNLTNKGIKIVGDGWQLKTGGVYTNPKGSILRIGTAITNANDFLYYPVTDRATGLVLKDFAVVAAAGVFNTAHGRHGVNIDGTPNVNGYAEFFQMDNVFIDNMNNGYSLYVNGQASPGQVLIDSSIRNCVLMNSYFNNVADNITIERCVFGANCFATAGGPNVGIYVSQVPGATNFKILGNNFVNQDGMILIDRAQSPIIRDNEFEQNPGTIAQGSMIYLRGSVGTIVGAAISGGSMALNSTTSTAYVPVRIGAAQVTKIKDVAIYVPSTSYLHIQIDAAATRTVIRDNSYYCGGVISDGIISNGGTLTTIDRGFAIAQSVAATLDASTQATLSIANGANAAISTVTGGVDASLCVISENAVLGAVAAVLLGWTTVNIMPGANAVFVAGTTPAAGKIGIGWDGNVFRVYNNFGSTIGIKVVRMRAT